jgi:hypothetical protein
VEVCIWKYGEIALLCTPNIEGIGTDTEVKVRRSIDSIICWRYACVVCAVSDVRFVNMQAASKCLAFFNYLLIRLWNISKCRVM